MFGHVFRPGHAFCYHFPCTFVRLKCCFSARATGAVIRGVVCARLDEWTDRHRRQGEIPASLPYALIVHILGCLIYL